VALPETPTFLPATSIQTMTTPESPLSFDIPGIKECQQNRYPLLFVDQITDVIPGSRARGRKAFSYNEWFFPAHFEDEPTVPGFIQIESLVQTFIMTFLSMPEYKGKKTGFASIKSFQFRRKIVPGETLDILANLDSLTRGVAKGRAVGSVDGTPACEGEFVITVPDILNRFRPHHPSQT
jgi:3-hydroxyacyl-[acyl-carrier-protein] dehydratase